MKIHKALWFGLSCIGIVLLMIAFLTPVSYTHLTLPTILLV